MKKNIPLILLLSLNLWSQPIIKAPIPIKGEKFVELDGMKVSDYYQYEKGIIKIGDDHFIVLTPRCTDPVNTDLSLDSYNLVKKFGTKVADRLFIWKNKDKIISINKKALPWANIEQSPLGDSFRDIKKTKNGLSITMENYVRYPQCIFNFSFVHKKNDYILNEQSVKCINDTQSRETGYISDSAKQNLLYKNVSIKNFNPDNFRAILKKLKMDEVNVQVRKTYFYSTPNEKSKTKAYLTSSDLAHVQKVFKDRNGQTWYFVRFVAHLTTEKETKGWLRGKDMRYNKFENQISFFKKDW